MKERFYVLSVLVICLSACSCKNAPGRPAAQGVVAGSGEAPSKGQRQAATPVLIDARSPQEYAVGHLDGALLMPHDAIGSLIEAQVPDKRTPILLYCHSGGRSELARETLVALGYTNVENLGGLQAAAGKLRKEVVK